jgi:phosphatidylglycerol:prolipoprotein diacylglycerol transferase
MRFVAEFWRQPDSQLGFLFGGWLTMGQSLSAMMMAVAVVLWFYFDRKLSKR